MFTIQTTVECFLLPADGDAAKATFLKHLQDPHEMWIIAYSFTLDTMIDEIIANATGGDPIHIYLDHSQSTGTYEAPEVERLVAAGVEVTIGTSPAGTSFITHTKGFVCDDTPVAFCWEGSVNFSDTGWMQVNTAMNFNDATWREQFVAQFEALRDYAWTNERSYQLMSEPPPGVTIGPSTDAGATLVPPPAKKSGKKKSAGAKPGDGSKSGAGARSGSDAKSGAGAKSGSGAKSDAGVNSGADAASGAGAKSDAGKKTAAGARSGAGAERDGAESVSALSRNRSEDRRLPGKKKSYKDNAKSKNDE